MEVDIAGLVASLLITQAVRQFITGRYPAIHHFLLQIAGHEPSHVSTDYRRFSMLCCPVFIGCRSL